MPKLIALDPLIRVGSIVGLGAGILLIGTLNVQLGILGVLLVIFSLVSLMAVVHNALSRERSD